MLSCLLVSSRGQVVVNSIVIVALKVQVNKFDIGKLPVFSRGESAELATMYIAVKDNDTFAL